MKAYIVAKKLDIDILPTVTKEGTLDERTITVRTKAENKGTLYVFVREIGHDCGKVRDGGWDYRVVLPTDACDVDLTPTQIGTIQITAWLPRV